MARPSTLALGLLLGILGFGGHASGAQPLCAAFDDRVLKELAMELIEHDLAGVRLAEESSCVARLRAQQDAATTPPRVRVLRDPIQDAGAIRSLGLEAIADGAKVKITRVRRLDLDTASAEYTLAGVKKKGVIEFLLDTDAEKQASYGCARLLSIKGPWRVRKSCMP